MISFRSGASNGEWCCLLVSSILWTVAYRDDPYFETHKLVLLISPFLTVGSLLWAARLLHDQDSSCAASVICEIVSSPFKKTAKKTQQPSSSFDRSDLALALTAAVAAWKIFGLYHAATAFAACVGHSLLLPKLFAVFPASFTFGEGCLALHSAVVYTVHSAFCLWNRTDDVTTVSGSFDVIGRICLLSVEGVLFLPLTRVSRCFKSSTFFLAYAAAFFCATTYPLLWVFLKRNPLLWLVSHAHSSPALITLITAWAALVIVALLVVKARTKKATTAVRKVFHLLVILVAVTGLWTDLAFTCLASQLVLGAFVVLEFIRAFEIQPLSGLLNEAFAVFIDEKDQGLLVLTNVYLLIGTFVPLWITPPTATTALQPLILLSGVLSIGIGDSAASIVGSKLGRIKWPQSSKTVEGTFASVLSQLAFILVAKSAHFPGLENVEIMTGVFPVICLGSIFEALTTQVDNIVLPLMLYLMLSLTSH